MSTALVERESTRTGSLGNWERKLLSSCGSDTRNFWNMFIGSRVGDRFGRTTAGTDH